MEDEAKLQKPKESCVETKICEHCGKEYVPDEYTECAPFSMCTDCYDDWLCSDD